jgi:hypothetical protein
MRSETSNMMSDMIQRHLGREVTVFYVTEVSDCDDGVLVEYDGECALLERSDKMDLLIPMSAIRMIMTMRDESHGTRTLPRPVGANDN